MKRAFSCAVIAGLFGSISLPAFAQTEAVDEGASDSAAIVVTAQRREQNLQDVPLAVTAIGSDALARAGVPDTQQLTKLTPSLTMTQTNLSVTPFIRGIGTASGTVGTDAAVATYVDGVYIQSAQAALFNFNNIERVEILRGPQGTLFGRNTTGGLIQVVTKDPSQATAVDVSATYQNFDTITGNLYATGSLGGDLAVSLALAGRKQGRGYGRNTFLNEEIDRQNFWAGRSEVQYETGILKVNLSGDYQHSDGGIGLNRQPVPGTNFFDGTPAPLRPRETRSNVSARSSLYQWGATLNASVDLSESVSVHNITAYRKTASRYLYDQDGSSVANTDVDIRQFDKSLQQELFVGADLGALNLTTGLFYYWTLGGSDPNQTTSTTTATLNRRRFTRLTTNAYAAYAQGTYAITDSTNFTVGLRYTREKRSVEGYVTDLAGVIVPASSLASRVNKSTGKLTWRFALDQKLGDDVLVYASVNRGYRGGSFNGALPTQAALKPEVLDSYEAGIKTELLDRQLRFNLAGYIYNYDNLAVNQVVAGSIVAVNAAKAKARGLEMELDATPDIAFGKLRLHSSAGYAWGEYSSFPGGPISIRNPFTATPAGLTCFRGSAVITSSTSTGGNTTCTGDLSGKKLVRMPTWTASVGAEYRFPAAGGEWTVSGDYYHSSSFFFEPANRLKQPAYSLINAQLSFQPEGSPLRFRIFGSNLANKTYFSQGSEQALGDLVSYGTPRIYGIGADISL
ncbi:TonB-dependent receptor [Sphingobium chlorophenolicum L-1]|uniref:TonB-dependent receptor n=1 Tax=Sphingobium chlorophenolicum L-1 TaxID=690566 RepID=F6EW93_SPHCR|nr:TonB-dependent receptor [Sphingobium chlorophenolicum]AEG49787.1 TonB-dependent receptor [Sphingobium chlorophenolicum L-1]